MKTRKWLKCRVKNGAQQASIGRPISVAPCGEREARPSLPQFTLCHCPLATCGLHGGDPKGDDINPASACCPNSLAAHIEQTFQENRLLVVQRPRQREPRKSRLSTTSPAPNVSVPSLFRIKVTYCEQLPSNSAD
ncbi:hypothetical protein VTI74DRAFT_7910 [Chaetomium olivicolor]